MVLPTMLRHVALKSCDRLAGASGELSFFAQIRPRRMTVSSKNRAIITQFITRPNLAYSVANNDRKFL